MIPPTDLQCGSQAPPEPDGWADAALFSDPAGEHFAEACDVPSTAPACGTPMRLPLPASEAHLVQWIAAICLRNEQALCALYDATLPRVYGLVLKIVRKPALAEEVVEDTYFQVWRQAPRFDPERGVPMAWLLGMARSRAIDTLRREAPPSSRRAKECRFC